jgi:serine/threonine protein kinase
MNYPVVFGKYVLLERINVGGMAEVFKAKTFGIDGFERILAIKRILPNMADDEEFINMFVDEARIAVQLAHNNIVQIYELGKYEQQYYIAMEYVSGKDLRQVLDRFRKNEKTFPVAEAAYIATKICDGLDYAHRKNDPTGKPLNFIHRDVSPQNILMGYEGDIKITDFGIAKAEDRASKTQAGVLKGKFGYMSPEQVRGLDIDRRSDIFAVGILMYEMLTGKRLFVGESDFATLEKVRNAEITPPREANPQLSEDLEKVMMKALAAERDERYQWASELSEALQRYLIIDNTIFTGKKLAELLSQEYAEDIEQEKKRMEEYKKLPVPATHDVISGANTMRNAPKAAKSSRDWNESDRTMIFESGFASDGASTTHGGPLPDIPTGPGVESSAPRRGEHTTARARRKRNRLLALTFAAAVVVLGLIGVLLGLLLNPAGRYGTLMLTSEPTQDVEVFLDGKKIASHTPSTVRDIPIGPHKLLARSTGYQDKAYVFELEAAAPAMIAISLEPLNAGTVEVVSEPEGAEVRIAGLQKGSTPLTLKDIDIKAPLVMDIVKAGFRTETVSVNFKPGERSQTVKVTLQPLVTTANVQPETNLPKNKDASLKVQSTPGDAEVYLNQELKGKTPLEIKDLDSEATYSLAIRKPGYVEYSKPVSFEAKKQEEVTVQLHREREVEGVPKVAVTPKPEKKKPAAVATPEGCEGASAMLSLMAQGAADCKVKVGELDLGVAPFFKRQAPAGNKCPIVVTCPDGKVYQSTLSLKAGGEVKLIIKPEDWK